MDLTIWMKMAIALMAIMLYMNSKYRKNYYFQAVWLLLGTWFYVMMLNAYAAESIVFPLICLVFNTMVNVLLIAENRMNKEE